MSDVETLSDLKSHCPRNRPYTGRVYRILILTTTGAQWQVDSSISIGDRWIALLTKTFKIVTLEFTVKAGDHISDHRLFLVLKTESE